MIVFWILSVLHIAVILWLFHHWNMIATQQTENLADVKFSVLVPVRNEGKRISNLLSDFNNLDYPRDAFEVIVIDDHSEDDTAAVVQRFGESANFDLRLISSNAQGKKLALTLGVSLAAFDHIVTTDGDCRVPQTWLAAYATGYGSTEVVMQTGPVLMKGRGAFSALQSVEFSALIGFGAAALRSGNPSMCNGANMSYLKSVFNEVGGYQGNDQIPTGDDEFLLQKVHKRYPGRICFLKNEDAIVTTDTKASIRALLNQRIRWSSKWKYHKSFFVKLIAVGFFMDYLVFIAAGLSVTLGILEWWVFLGVLLTRLVSEWLFIYSVSNFLKIKKIPTLPVSLGLQIIYPVFVSLLGLASIFGKYSWKGRKY